MPAYVLVDSSAWIEAMRPGGDPLFRAAVTEALRRREAAVCEVVAAEILRGARDARELALLQADLATPEHLSMTGTAHLAGQLALSLRQQGLAIPTTDLLVAATASLHGASLLHCDKHLDLAAAELGVPVVEP